MARSKAFTSAAALTGGDYIGDQVGWDMASILTPVDDVDEVAIPRTTVRDIFTTHGFGHVLYRDDEMDAGDALLTATKASGLRPGKGIVISPMKPKGDTPASVAVYIKQAKSGEVGDHFHPGARVRINSTTGEYRVRPLEGQVEMEKRCEAVAKRIAAKADQLRTHVCNDELSQLLCDAGRSTRWTPYRIRGTVWFVYSSHADRFRALLDDLEQFPGFVSNVTPLFKDSDGRTERNVQRASQRTLESELKELNEQLKKAQDDGMRKSALENRINECDELLAKAELYSAMLADASKAISEKADALKDQFRQQLDAAADGTKAAFSTKGKAKPSPKAKKAGGAKRATKKAKTGDKVIDSYNEQMAKEKAAKAARKAMRADWEAERAEREMQRIEAEGDRAQTKAEEKAKADAKEAIESVPLVTFRRSRGNGWVICGPVDVVKVGPVVVTKKDGTTDTVEVVSVGRPFNTDKGQMAYGYLPKKGNGGKAEKGSAGGAAALDPAMVVDGEETEVAPGAQVWKDDAGNDVDDSDLFELD